MDWDDRSSSPLTSIEDPDEFAPDPPPAWSRVSSRPLPKFRPSRRPIPHEVLAIITSILVDSDQLESASKLARLGKASFRLVTTRLYHVVKLTSPRHIHSFLSNTALGIIHITDPASTSPTRRSPSPITSRCISQMKHLDIELPENMEEPVQSGLALLFKPNAIATRLEEQGISIVRGNLESLRIVKGGEGGPTDEPWIHIIFSLFQAKHLQWRIVMSVRTRFFTFQSTHEPRSFPELNRGPALTIGEHWMRSVLSWDPEFGASFDIPCANRWIPLEKLRFMYEPTQMRAHFRSYLFTLPGWMQHALLDVDSPRSGPNWILYNLPNQARQRALEGMATALPEALRGNTELLDNFVTFYDDPFITAGSGDEWREWLKRDEWGARRKKAAAAE